MDLTTEAVRLSIGMARLRAEVASTNIANVDVPGYRPQRLDFGHALGLLQQAADDPATSSDSLASITPAQLRATEHTADPDTGVAVNLDGEVAELETASVDYQSLTTVLSRRFALMQLAMAGRN